MDKKHITLSYDPGRADGPWFMSTGPVQPPKGKGKYDPLKIAKGKPAELVFKIETKGIKFRDGNPIEISLIPNQNPPGDLQQFSWPKEGKTTLTVTNANQDSQHTEYYYKLNFDNGTSLDPIIQNGCCRSGATADTGGSMSLLSDSSAAGALLLAALVIVLAAIRLRRARA